MWRMATGEGLSLLQIGFRKLRHSEVANKMVCEVLPIWTRLAVHFIGGCRRPSEGAWLGASFPEDPLFGCISNKTEETQDDATRCYESHNWR